jgi:sugar lactone lactonase YvrE
MGGHARRRRPRAARPDGGVARRHVGAVAAVIRPRRRPGWLVATERAVALTDDDALDATISTGRDLWSDPRVRSNEGACDPDGRFHLGTMAYDAIFGGAAVHRYDSDGRLDAVVPIPVRQPTAVAFIGDDLQDLVVTTSRYGLGPSAESAAGALFVIAGLGVTGAGPYDYAG